MIAACARAVVAETRCSAKLADDDNEDLPVKASAEDVFNQCRQSLIHIWQPDSHVLREVAGTSGVGDVVVPVREFLTALRCVEVDVNDRRTGLGQSTSQQAGLAPLVATVPVSQRIRLLIDRECLRDMRAGHQLERQLLKPVDTVELAAGIQVASQPVKLLQQRLSLAEKFAIAARRQFDLRRLIAVRIRIVPV